MNFSLFSGTALLLRKSDRDPLQVDLRVIVGIVGFLLTVPSHDHGLVHGHPVVVGRALRRNALFSVRLAPLALTSTVALATFFLAQWTAEPSFAIGASFERLEFLFD